VATGNENYLTFGSFTNDATADYTGCLMAPIQARDSYYWIDDILVEDVTITAGGACGILPIELVKFETIPENNSVKVKWETNSEVNNDYFTIEKSNDGTQFLPVGTVHGAGTSSATLSYSFVDDQPYQGINYYRLKQVDYDGQFTYSKTISVNVSEGDAVTEYFDLYGRKISPAHLLQSGIYIQWDGNTYKKVLKGIIE